MNSCISCLSRKFFTQKETDWVSTIISVSIFPPNFSPPPLFLLLQPLLITARCCALWLLVPWFWKPIFSGSRHGNHERSLSWHQTLGDAACARVEIWTVQKCTLVFSCIDLEVGFNGFRELWEWSMGKRYSRESSDIPLSLWNLHSTLEDR